MSLNDIHGKYKRQKKEIFKVAKASHWDSDLTAKCTYAKRMEIQRCKQHPMKQISKQNTGKQQKILR